MRHVILGNGTAGVTAAETIRKNAPDDTILLVGDEPGLPYSRMSIPRLLSGEIGDNAARIRREQEFFTRHRIDLVAGRAQHISARTRTVKMEDGCVIPFDTLLIATGAAPRKPPIAGIDMPGVHSCWTLDDARRIIAAASPQARVVLIGAGFIGCIVMEALARRGVRLAVVEKRDRILPGMLSPGAGRMVQRWCESKGIRVLTGARVTGIGTSQLQDIDGPKLVRLSNGELLHADLVVHCAGTVPNIDFLKGSGIQCLRGVVVDASMQTSMPGVYAAGDCAERYDMQSGRSVISGVQPNAADQAYCAALNMTGKRAYQRGVRQIDVIDTMGLVSSSFGQWQGIRDGQWVEYCDTRSYQYLRLEFGRDMLVGCNAVGLTEHAGILRGLIQHQVRLGEWKDRLLENPLLVKDAYRDCVQQQYMWQSSPFHATAPVSTSVMRAI